MTCVVVGIAGASGSGKTFLAKRLARELREEFGALSVAVIQEDFYYKDQSSIPEAERAHTNYDHPDSMDHHLLSQQLAELKSGRSVELPQYDYHHHTRAVKTLHMQPAHVIIVEGILLFSDAELRKELDCLIFVETPLDICLIRRAERDMRERGRTYASVVQQYQATVRPMFYEFVEPSKHWADIIIPSWRDNKVAVEVLKTSLRAHLWPSRNEEGSVQVSRL